VTQNYTPHPDSDTPDKVHDLSFTNMSEQHVGTKRTSVPWTASRRHAAHVCETPLVCLIWCIWFGVRGVGNIRCRKASKKEAKAEAKADQAVLTVLAAAAVGDKEFVIGAMDETPSLATTLASIVREGRVARAAAGEIVMAPRTDRKTLPYTTEKWRQLRPNQDFL
jgi:hypothetical protein